MTRVPLSDTARVPLVPNRIHTYEEEQRAWHFDIAAMPTLTLRAEQHLLRHELAARVWGRRRGFLCRGIRQIPITTWLQERLRNIRAELQRRQESA